MSSRARRKPPPTPPAAAVSAEELEAFARDHEIAETELVFGLVGALGTDIERVSELLHLALEQMAYTTREIHLSSLLREIDWDESLDEKAKLDVYISTHMDAGDRLRREWERPDALALLAIAKILAQREALPHRGTDASPRLRLAVLPDRRLHPR